MTHGILKHLACMEAVVLLEFYDDVSDAHDVTYIMGGV